MKTTMVVGLVLLVPAIIALCCLGDPKPRGGNHNQLAVKVQEWRVPSLIAISGFVGSSAHGMVVPGLHISSERYRFHAICCQWFAPGLDLGLVSEGKFLNLWLIKENFSECFFSSAIVHGSGGQSCPRTLVEG